MQPVKENEMLRKRTCKTATDWPSKKSSNVVKERSFQNDGVLFIVSAFISDSDNACLFALALASVIVHHPTADILIVDQQSPPPGRKLLDGVLSKLLVHKKRAEDGVEGAAKKKRLGTVSVVRPSWPTACKSRPCVFPGDLSFSGENASAHGESYFLAPPSGKEIGALKEGIRYVEESRQQAQGTLPSSQQQPPPSLVVFLQHSTGLRSPLPLSAIASLQESDTCRIFPLDVPWFRVEDPSGKFWKSRYGTTNVVDHLLDERGALPTSFSRSPVNTLWHASSHGIFAAPWASLLALRDLGLLSDASMDACARMNCCCFEQYMGMAISFLARGNDEHRKDVTDLAKLQLEWGGTHPTTSPQGAPHKPFGNFPANLTSGNHKPSEQEFTGTMRDLRCNLPLTWKLHGGSSTLKSKEDILALHKPVQSNQKLRAALLVQSQKPKATAVASSQ